MTYRKKLIEVALPLETINRESAREKSIRHGHPSTLHLWWARRPLAACRAVLFASLVDDPSSHPEQFPTEEAQGKERQRLFSLIEDLVKWENSNNEQVLDAARAAIRKTTGGNPPPVLDPFCGGGSIPLEAQRLGLKAYASDLNPVAVLITKALIEIPPKFADMQPVNPSWQTKSGAEKAVHGVWHGAKGLAEDIRYYGKWMRGEAEKRIGHLFPKVKVSKEHLYGGGEATVIAWLWARTVKCPNPACGAQMPLARSFWLSTKKGRQAWVEPVIDKKHRIVSFEVCSGNGSPPEGTVNRRGAQCIVCKTPVPFDHIRTEGKANRMGTQLMAIVAEGKSERLYVAPIDEHESVAQTAKPTSPPDTNLPVQALGFRVQLYGMLKHADLFTQRQLVALTTFSDLVSEARELVLADAKKAGLSDDGNGLNDGGTGATAYADAVTTYLAFAVDKAADYWSNLCTWHSSKELIRNTFGRQALPMVWDFAEPNPFQNGTGGFGTTWAEKVLLALTNGCNGYVKQLDATSAVNGAQLPMISTDPPYYDNIGYADLSDFFYIWLRRSIGKYYENLFSTVLVPKAQELVATPYRFDGDKNSARQFFETGLGKAFEKMRVAHHPDYPLTVYYAFKQSETDNESEEDEAKTLVTVSTGWETMLEGLIRAGFSITGTWPMRTELSNRMVGRGTNALVSSILLVCRPKLEYAPLATRREFSATLKKELPLALNVLQHGNIAPVDLAQASIGPGMAIFTRYSKVLEADGTPMSVRTSLQIINQELDAYLAAQEGDMDRDTRFCLAWFEQFGMSDAPFGEADVLARAKNTSVQGLVDAGVLATRGGKVRLLKRSEYEKKWDPTQDGQISIWKCVQYLIRELDRLGEEGAARLCTRLGGGKSEESRALAYRLYSICEKKAWAEEALACNSLVISWPSVQDKVARFAGELREQGELFFEKVR